MGRVGGQRQREHEWEWPASHQYREWEDRASVGQLVPTAHGGSTELGITKSGITDALVMQKRFLTYFCPLGSEVSKPQPWALCGWDMSSLQSLPGPIQSLTPQG